MSEAFNAALAKYNQATELINWRTERIRQLQESLAEAKQLDDCSAARALCALLAAEIEVAGRPSPFYDRLGAVVARWEPPAIPAACYVASFGWVHVRPGCRCGQAKV